MSTETLDNFAVALIDRSGPMPEGLTAWNGPQPARRFEVYRNNVTMGLIGALETRFPAASAIVGEAFFAAMARDYIALTPPASPVLLAYGDTFPDFVATFEPARDLTYLSDVMRIEVARSHAYHAADAAPLDPALLASIASERLGEVTFVPHPSLSVVRSAHPAITIWEMNSGGRPIGPIDPWLGEDALIVRPEMLVEIHRLPVGGAAFVVALAEGRILAEAVGMAMQDDAAFDLSTNLAGILSAGAFTAIIAPE